MIITFIGALIALILSFYLLNEVTDRYFIPSLDNIGKRMNMSDDAAGATLMAAGSSAPELFIAIFALIYGGDNVDIGIGTIVGSALFNLLVILGAVALVRKAVVAWQPMLRDIIFYTLSIILLYWAYSDGHIDYIETSVFLGFYLIYIIAVMNWKRWLPYERHPIEEGEEDDDPKWKRYLKPIDYVVHKIFPDEKYIYTNFSLSIVVIALLSWLLVESAATISEFLSIPKYIIALTVLAFGTSVPDMISSIIVAKQGRGGMAISNALGSNIFDILIGLGLPWLIMALNHSGGFSVPSQDLLIHVLFLLGSVIIVFLIFLLYKWTMTRKVGLLLLAMYLIYLGYIIYAASPSSSSVNTVRHNTSVISAEAHNPFHGTLNIKHGQD